MLAFALNHARPATRETWVPGASSIRCDNPHMASPTVFVSSTFYDLRYIRESLKRMIETLGYNAVLSEDGAVFYDPATSASESCFKEVPSVDLFVLIIGGRYGSLARNSDKSVTNGEYQTAIRQHIPVFALVEQGTANDFELYRANASRPDVLASISFPHADSPKIFEFIEEVQTRAQNNAIAPFRNFSDIESYLRQQWAGMMYAFLRRGTEERQMADSLTMLTQVNSRIELLAEQILKNVGSPLDRIVVKTLQRMLTSRAIADLRYVHINPTPADIVRYDSFDECASAYGKRFKESKDSTVISSDGYIAVSRLKENRNEYRGLRSYILELLKESSVSAEDLVAYDFGGDLPKSPGTKSRVPAPGGPLHDV
ncbi:DUF4062 domain-containing protein [Micromonospora sp. CPCC 206171]|uniref:DUF4062 domain-containing protein n=1 Tax=Micromonospora sp. CPCC 206171 TaxID=3122405 RepID=UPI002FF36173